MTGMKYRCLVCKERFVLRPGTKACFRCLQPVPKELVPVQERPAARPSRGSGVQPLSKKERARRAKQRSIAAGGGSRPAASAEQSKRGSRDGAMLGRLTQSGTSLVLVTVDRSIHVTVRSDIDVGLLINQQLTWMMRDRGNGTAVVTPFESAELRRMRAEQDVKDRAARQTLGAYSILHPRAPGRSKIEQAKGRDQVALIRHLAQRQDDPSAWAELCSAWRVKSIRALIKQALLDIGLDKIRRLLHMGHPGWPDGLFEWVEDEAKKLTARSDGARRSPVYYAMDGLDPNSDFLK
jgi:hypothetical protein